MSLYLADACVSLINNTIQANIGAALDAVSVAHPDGISSYEYPAAFLTYDDADTKQLPVIYIIAKSVDFQKAAGPNYISAKFDIIVSAVVEDVDRENLTRKAYRYFAALHKVLDQTEITSADTLVKLFIRVERGQFSQVFSDSDDPNSAGRGMRKEVALELSVDHAENFS